MGRSVIVETPSPSTIITGSSGAGVSGREEEEGGENVSIGFDMACKIGERTVL